MFSIIYAETKDGKHYRIAKYPEVMSIMETLKFNVINNSNEYVSNKHREKDCNIEDWLEGKIKIVQNEKEHYEYLNKLKKELEGRDKYVI